MDIDERKRSIISRIYYNPIGGFGSIVATHKKARDVDSSITCADVKTFLDKQAVRQRKNIPRYNSFIPEGRLEQIQIDLADFGKAQSRFRYGLIAIDVFYKVFSCCASCGQAKHHNGASFGRCSAEDGTSIGCAHR